MAHRYEARCKYHPTADIVEDYRAGDMICSQCGLVVGDRVVDVSSEWRTFANDDKKRSSDDPSRVGGGENHLLTGAQLTTGITFNAKIAANADCVLVRRSNLGGLQGTDRALTKGFQIISGIVGRLRIGKSTDERAKRHFRDVYVKTGMRGRSHESFAAACVYIACKEDNISKPLRDLCAVSKVNKTDIQRAYKKVREVLQLTIQSAGPAQYLPTFCSKLSLPHRVQNATRLFLQKADKLHLMGGRTPMTVAGAAIFMVATALREEITLQSVSQVIGMTEGTLKSAYREFYPVREELLKFDNFPVDLSALPDFGDAVALGVNAQEQVAKRIAAGDADFVPASKTEPEFDGDSGGAAAAAAAAAPKLTRREFAQGVALGRRTDMLAAIKKEEPK